VEKLLWHIPSSLGFGESDSFIQPFILISSAVAHSALAVLSTTSHMATSYDA
jgi:hypothetical protein